MIPDSFVEQVRERVDIAELIGKYVALQKAGKEWKACCPFHEEDTPSFYVVPDKRFFKCFGCGESGDAFNFLMKHKGHNFPDAVRAVAEQMGMEVPRDEARSRREDRNRPLIEALSFAEDFYHRTLLETEEAEAARTYLKGRGLDEDTVRRFRLGYAPDSWRALRDAANAHGISDDVLRAAGLVKDSERSREPFDRQRARITFPIRDARNRTVGFSGRILEARDGAPKYLNTPETAVFQKGRTLYGFGESKNAIGRDKAVFVVEGQMDYIALAAAGVENVVAPLGTSMTEEHARLLSRRAPRAYLLYDSDSAGEKATFRTARALLAEGVHPLVVRLPHGEDPDSLMQAGGVDALKSLVGEAQDVIDRQLEMLQERGLLDRPDQLRKAVESMLDTVRAVQDPILRDIYLGRIAETTRVPVATMDEVLGIERREPFRALAADDGATEPPRDGAAGGGVQGEGSPEASTRDGDLEAIPRDVGELPVRVEFDVPQGVRLSLHSLEGRVALEVEGGRARIRGEDGARGVLMGRPGEVPDAFDPDEWYRGHRIARPFAFRITSSGSIARLEGDIDIPQTFLDREEVAPVREALVSMARGAAPVEKERESDSRAEEVVADPVLSVEADEGEQVHLLVVAGRARVERDDAAYRVYARDGARFLLARVPDGATPDVLRSWLVERPEGRPTAYVYRADSGIKREADMLDATHSDEPVPGTSMTWADVLRCDLEAGRDLLARKAVGAGELADYLDANPHSPDALVGSGGELYAPLLDGVPSESAVEIRGEVAGEARARVLKVERVDRDSGELLIDYFAPVGGRYVVQTMPEGEPPATGKMEPAGLLVREDGRVRSLPTSAKSQVWAGSEALPQVDAVRRRKQAPARTEVSADANLDLIMDEGDDYEPTPDELLAAHMDNERTMGVVPPEPVTPERAEERTDAGRTGEGWQSAQEGAVHVGNWRQRSPRGELWVAELLETVATPEELSTLDCLRSIRLLRQGYQLSRTDEARFEHALGELSPRIERVRVFSVNGQSFFAYDRGTYIRLVGPGGRGVRSEEIRERVAASYGRDPETCFQEAPVHDRGGSAARRTKRQRATTG